MKGRTWSDAAAYQPRYGFNGKEKDAEGMGGGGSTYDYGFRIYNPRIAKFLSVDPLTSTYPSLTPYQFASNTPIQAIDLDGLEAVGINGWNAAKSRQRDAALKNGNAQQVATITKEMNQTAVLGMTTGGLLMGGGAAPAALARATPYIVSMAAGLQRYSNQIMQYGADIGNLIYGAVTDDPIEPFPANNQLASDAGKALRYSVALGIRELKPPGKLWGPDILTPFAEQVGALEHKVWASRLNIDINAYQEAGKSFGDLFKDVVNGAIKSGGQIHFNVTGFNIDDALKLKGVSYNDLPKSTITNWEFNQLFENADYLKNSKFWRDGKDVTEDIIKEVKSKTK